MTKKYSLQAQISEVEREVKMREEVYPRRVKSGHMRESVATMQTDLMKSVLVTLQWLQEHEAEVRAYAAEKKGRAA